MAKAPKKKKEPKGKQAAEKQEKARESSAVMPVLLLLLAFVGVFDVIMGFGVYTAYRNYRDKAETTPAPTESAQAAAPATVQPPSLSEYHSSYMDDEQTEIPETPTPQASAPITTWYLPPEPETPDPEETPAEPDEPETDEPESDETPDRAETPSGGTAETTPPVAGTSWLPSTPAAPSSGAQTPSAQTPATQTPTTQTPAAQTPTTQTPTTPTTQTPADSQTSQGSTSYILNRDTRTFHRLTCSTVAWMDPASVENYTGTREDVLRMTYEPCTICNP